MVEAAARLVLSKAADHWEGVLTLALVILYGRNDYRVSKLEKSVCVSPETCVLVRATCLEREAALKAELGHGENEFAKIREELTGIKTEIKENQKYLVGIILKSKVGK